ncbi:MAG TPA: glycosyltransferase family 4 protein [Blastocatellia bacterium]|nr:glycosyltransferase family 4 protein [Blastocatellia bacterium]
MKILSLSTCPLDPLLGSGKTRLRWSEGLRELGHSVDMAEPHDYETWHGMRRALRFRQAWGACSFVKNKLAADSYDAIEFFGGEFGLVTSQLSKLKQRPLIVAHTDGLELLASERERVYNPPRSFMGHAHSWYLLQTHERLSRAAFVYADAFVTGSALDREYVIEHGIFEPERTAVVEPGLDDEYFAMPFINKKQHRVAYTGSWIPRKGIDKLTSVMNELLNHDRELRFDVYGTGGNPEAVLSRFPTCLHERIEVHGRLSNEQLAEAMTRAKVFFFPSQYEGFGMSLGEAMACSCAVVTTPTGFGAELRGGVEAIVCGFDDVEAMKSSVLGLLSDEQERLRIARAGWERVRTLRWDSNIKKLEATYERWCSERRAHRDRVTDMECAAPTTLV